MWVFLFCLKYILIHKMNVLNYNNYTVDYKVIANNDKKGNCSVYPASRSPRLNPATVNGDGDSSSNGEQVVGSMSWCKSIRNRLVE